MGTKRYRIRKTRCPNGLQQQKALARAQHDEIGLARARADRQIVPDEVVVFEAALELVQHPAFTGIAARVDVAKALRKLRHGIESDSDSIRPARANAANAAAARLYRRSPSVLRSVA